MTALTGCLNLSKDILFWTCHCRWWISHRHAKYPWQTSSRRI